MTSLTARSLPKRTMTGGGSLNPARGSYHPQATLPLKTEQRSQHQRRAGRFILATNVLAAEALSPPQALQEYKAQQRTEHGFRFLKAPWFFASSVFLKSPECIMALAFVMAVGLLVYNLGQRQLRQALQQANQTLPNQLGKAPQRPTLRWIFQCFMAMFYGDPLRHPRWGEADGQSDG